MKILITLSVLTFVCMFSTTLCLNCKKFCRKIYDPYCLTYEDGTKATFPNECVLDIEICLNGLNTKGEALFQLNSSSILYAACTHFAWTDYNGGTCWMKKNNVSKSDAFESSDKSSVCGIIDVINDDSSNGWNKADLTNYESYPDPNSDECVIYNGCLWSGYFAFVSGKQPESWVKATNIIAVHSKDASKYKLKTLRLKQGNKQIDAKVYDMCSDTDCNGCCTKNCQNTGFLIDIEKYTRQRFGSGSGIVEWKCLHC